MRLISLITLGTMLLASCDQSPPAASPDAGEGAGTTAWPATKTTVGGAFSVTVEPSKGEIRWNEHFSLNLAIKPEKPGRGPLKVLVDADMPAHKHGMNTQAELVEIGESQYRVDGMLFHMKGDWVITVEVTGGGGIERATFPVLIK